MRIIIIGGVAAGTSAAAKARRNTESAEIIVYEKDDDISYSVCGLPYYISDPEITRDMIVPRSPLWFKTRYNIEIKTSHEVLEIKPESKQILVKNLSSSQTFLDSYDKLILATGAQAFIPSIPNVHLNGVFTLRNVFSADKIKSFIKTNNPKSALICGSGFIGLEMLETLTNLGIQCTVIDQANQILPGFDSDISKILKKQLEKKGIHILLQESLQQIHGSNNIQSITTLNGTNIPTDLLILSIGVRPNINLAQKTGIKIGSTGAISINNKMETSIPHIYAAGDCAESFSLITGKKTYKPLGSTANKMGRIAGDSATGGTLEFKGILGTGICKIFDQTLAITGLSEKEALDNHYDIEIIHNTKPNQTEYLSTSTEMTIKAIADRKNGKLLGAQIIGGNGSDKRIDVLATAITFGAKVEDLFHLDLAYAPPYSTTKDPVQYSGMILDNALSRDRKIITPSQLTKKIHSSDKMIIIDVRETTDYEKGHIDGAINIPLALLRKTVSTLDPSQTYIVHCNKGTSGNAAQNILINSGFKDVYNLSGGYKNYIQSI